MRLILVILLLLFAAPVRADEIQTLQTLRTAMYVGEAADCTNSGILSEKHFPGGKFTETNPLVRPFSHGGVLTFCGGVAASNIVIGALTRRWPIWMKDVGASAQFASNVWGVRFTIKHTGF